MYRFAVILAFLPLLLFGQRYKKIVAPSDTFYVLNSLDTLSIPKGLPNGKWKMFFDHDTARPQYIFHLKNNKVNGFFISYYPGGSWSSMGTYVNDSLWTFRFEDSFGAKDTTFRFGAWEYRAGDYAKSD